jgi:hypothetical protein
MKNFLNQINIFSGLNKLGIFVFLGVIVAAALPMAIPNMEHWVRVVLMALGSVGMFSFGVLKGAQAVLSMVQKKEQELYNKVIDTHNRLAEEALLRSGGANKIEA